MLSFPQISGLEGSLCHSLLFSGHGTENADCQICGKLRSPAQRNLVGAGVDDNVDATIFGSTRGRLIVRDRLIGPLSNHK